MTVSTTFTSTMLQLPVATGLTGAEFMWINQGGTDKRVTVGDASTFPATSASFVMAISTPGLTASRLLAAETDVLTVTDGGALGNITVGVATNGITYAKFQQTDALSILGNATNALADIASIVGTTDQIMRVAGDGASLGFGSIDLSKSAAVGSSILKIENGGSARATADAYAVICGGTTSTSAQQSVSGVGVAGQYLISQGAGALPIWATGPASEPIDVVTTSSATIAAKTNAVAVQRVAPSTTDLALPSVAAQAGVPIHIFDWSTSVTDHVITITPDGAETIMLASTYPIASNSVSLGGVTLYPSTTLGGWYIAP